MKSAWFWATSGFYTFSHGSKTEGESLENHAGLKLSRWKPGSSGSESDETHFGFNSFGIHAKVNQGPKRMYIKFLDQVI